MTNPRPLTIQKIEHTQHHTIVFFDMPETFEAFSPKPGQFLIINPQQDPLYLAISLVNHKLSVAFENDIRPEPTRSQTKYFLQHLAKPNEKIMVIGPCGHSLNVEFLRQFPLSIFSAGMGVTVARMLKDNMSDQDEVHMYHSAKTLEDIPYSDVQKWNSDKNNLVSLSKENQIGYQYGRLTTHISNITISSHHVAFICGPTEFIKDIAKILTKEIKIPHSKIFICWNKPVLGKEFLAPIYTYSDLQSIFNPIHIIQNEIPQSNLVNVSNPHSLATPSRLNFSFINHSLELQPQILLAHQTNISEVDHAPYHFELNQCWSNQTIMLKKTCLVDNHLRSEKFSFPYLNTSPLPLDELNKQLMLGTVCFYWGNSIYQWLKNKWHGKIEIPQQIDTVYASSAETTRKLRYIKCILKKIADLPGVSSKRFIWINNLLDDYSIRLLKYVAKKNKNIPIPRKTLKDFMADVIYFRAEVIEELKFSFHSPPKKIKLNQIALRFFYHPPYRQTMTEDPKVIQNPNLKLDK